MSIVFGSVDITNSADKQLVAIYDETVTIAIQCSFDLFAFIDGSDEGVPINASPTFVQFRCRQLRLRTDSADRVNVTVVVCLAPAFRGSETYGEPFIKEPNNPQSRIKR